MAKKTDAEKENGLSWRAAEHEAVSRSPIWFFVVGSISLVLAVLALASGNFFFAVFVVLAFIMLVSLGRIKPRTLDFYLNEDGVGIGAKTFYHYDRFEGFAFNNRPGRLDEIVLKKKTAFNPFMKIPIDSKLAVEAQAFLEKKLPAIEYKESLIDVFSDWLEF